MLAVFLVVLSIPISVWAIYRPSGYGGLLSRINLGLLLAVLIFYLGTMVHMGTASAFIPTVVFTAGAFFLALWANRRCDALRKGTKTGGPREVWKVDPVGDRKVGGAVLGTGVYFFTVGVVALLDHAFSIGKGTQLAVELSMEALPLAVLFTGMMLGKNRKKYFELALGYALALAFFWLAVLLLNHFVRTQSAG